jgi:hypothetical protein
MPARRAFVVVMTAVVWIPPASAYESTGSVVADALLRSLEQSGYANVAAASVERTGARTVLSGVRGAPVEGGPGLTVGTVSIENGLVDAENALLADRIVYEDIRIGEPGGDGGSTVDEVVLDGVRLVDDPDGGGGFSATVGAFDSLSISGVEARADDGRTVMVETVAAALDGAGGEDFSGRLSMTGLAFDASLWTDALSQALTGLGYERVSLDVAAAGAWRAETGRIEIREIAVAGTDIGTLSLTAEMSGLKPGLLSTLQDNLDDVPQLLQTLQALSISALSVSYADDGLVERLMTRAASAADVPRDALAAEVAERLSGLVAPLGDAGFTARVDEAARTFLAEPGSVLLAATPRAPVTAAQLLGTAMLRPALIPSRLDLEIRAIP